jgi:anti-sigma factor RsiW
LAKPLPEIVVMGEDQSCECRHVRRGERSAVANRVTIRRLTSDDRDDAGVPYADASDRFGVSRTHVRSLMETAQAAGLVKLIGRGGRRVEIVPRFWASYHSTRDGIWNSLRILAPQQDRAANPHI